MNCGVIRGLLHCKSCCGSWNRDVYTFEGLEKNVDKAIDKVRPENYKNYFKNAYIIKDDTTYKRKPSTRKCKLKNYKS